MSSTAEVAAGLDGAAADAYRALVEHPAAPPWTHPRSDRLTPAMRRRVAAYAALVQADPPVWAPGEEPAWLGGWLDRTWDRVPRLAALGTRPPRLVDVPTACRDDLAAAVWAHVPTDVELDELLAYATSGTAGPPVTVPSHPVAVASYYPVLVQAARPAVDLVVRPDRLDWVTVISQQAGGYVVPSYSTWLGCLTAQVNLRPHAWRDPADAIRFLGAHDPRCITGDPVALADLAALDVDLHPHLMISSAAALPRGLRERLADRFGCPVLDSWSLTESGPAACSLGGPHRLVQPRLFVEALRADGSRCDPDEVGELALTGGLNPALPLIRHRTGDHGALSWPDGAVAPVVARLQGRTPVVLTAADGSPVNSHSVTVALEPLALPRFGLHQAADGSLRLLVDDPAAGAAARAIIGGLLGPLPVEVVRPPGDGELVPFTAADTTTPRR